jgi:hypothetical protein
MALPRLSALVVALAALSVRTLAAVTTAGSVSLTVTVWYPFDNLAPTDELFLRGDFGGLTWDQGLHLTVVGKNQVGGGVWWRGGAGVVPFCVGWLAGERLCVSRVCVCVV